MIINLKTIIKLQAVQQKDLAEAICVTARNDYNWEEGKSTLSVRTGFLIYKYLDTSIDIFNIHFHSLESIS